MNRQELIKAAAEQSGQSQSAVASALDALLDTVVSAVASGDKVTLVGFGTFEQVKRAARAGRNPATGAAITIAASTLPKFSPGKAFKDAVNR